ncbi:epoxide hydrolase [Punctularia strigosozonata HHB-11173 SS5]|uniref:epoxide hydrolase n=1 Tax=Punctularia strigosozonata (strain HHB-11173) TaxID=741275 RepID=UPI00044177DA|nr:epoxide hydrolase [Punctularia strigosozonata HHB-11173 SS5]EIN07733.1 epoxide hydrolase [Punctularia strigosozonata HHB-11173 SS5]
MSYLGIKAVIFDVGGVVCKSPLIAIAEYERQHGLPNNYINCSIVARGRQGAWQKFERGELQLYAFYDAFGRELSDFESGNRWYREYCARRQLTCPELPQSLNIDGRELFGRMMRGSHEYDAVVVEAIRRIRASGKYRVIALTNNYAVASDGIPQDELRFLGWDEGPTPARLRALFDDFCDSSALGMRKPEPEFYLLACKRNGIRPQEAIFLDDLGINLKAAKELGMDTIHVPIGGSLQAIKKLEFKLGVDLTSPTPSSKL